MTWLIVVLMVLILCLLVSIRMNVTGLVNERYWHQVDHAKCIAHVSHYTGNQFAAEVLKAAAEDYDSPLGQHEVEVLAQLWTAEQPRIPSIWMVNRADALIEEINHV